MLQRIWNYLKALFGFKMDNLEDPDVLLKQAQDEMRVSHEKNRERAIQAIAQKNNLQQQVTTTQAQVANLQAKAELSLKNGDKDLALQLLREKQTLAGTLEILQKSLETAESTVEQVKTAMKREEETIRTRTAQAMAMKTQWKQAQIQKELNKQLDGMGLDGQEAAFARAENKINAAVSESNARTELGKDSMQAKLSNLDAQVGDANANKELEELQVKLGLSPAPTTTYTPSTTKYTTAEEEIQQLTVGH